MDKFEDEWNQENQVATAPLTAEQRLKRFRATASPMARKLAGLLAATPITLPIVRLIQQTMLQELQLSHMAEAFLGGILEQLSTQDVVDTDYIQYDFIEGVHELLLDSLPTSESVQVIKNMSDFVAGRVGQFLDFRALLTDPTSTSTIETIIDENSRPFATVAEKVLRRLGGQYAALASQLEEAAVAAPPNGPPTPSAAG